MKKLLIIILSMSFAFSGVKYKTFKSLIAAINFIAKKYENATEHIGGNTWWSTHRILVIPKTHPEKHIADKSFDIWNDTFIKSCVYVVYWRY